MLLIGTRRAAAMVTLGFTLLITVRAAETLPALRAAGSPDGTVELSWPTTPGSTLQTSPRVGPSASWSPAPEVPRDTGGRTLVTLAPAAGTRFFRLARSGPTLVRVTGSSPAPGESGVAVTRETILRLSGPLSSNVAVDTDVLSASALGRPLLSRVEVARDRRSLTLFYLENLPGGSRVSVRLDGNGLLDETGQPIDGDGDGSAGGAMALDFTTAGTAAVPGTAVIGTVFASDRNPDGSNRPLAGVTVTVDGAEERLRAVTDASGAFRLDPSPAGRFFVHVDGRTAEGSQWPTGAYYPFVGKAWEAVAGKTNNLAGGSGEIFLPLVPGDALTSVSPTESTVIRLPPAVVAANPAMAGVSLTVPPDALFGESGIRGGRVGMAPVAPDRLPEPLPPGLNLPLVITIQTDGPMNFDRPVPVRFPNLPDPVTGVKLPPGARTALWSFNHDTGRWEIQGPMTVTADGEYAETDPGVGVRQPGWHGSAPGTNGDGPDGNEDHDGDGPNCPNGAPPACCEPGGWDKLKEQCEKEKELALNATLDTTIDGIDFLLEAIPGGCLASGAFETAKTARDCAVVGQFTGECADIASDNGIGFGLSCIPVVGGVLDLGWSGKQLIDNLSNFDSCLDNIAAVCGFDSARAQLHHAPHGSLLIQDPRVERIKALVDLQLRVIEASSNLLARVYGSPVWSKASSPTELTALRTLLEQLRAALAPDSLGGTTATAEERAALLALPRPNGASASDVSQLIDRIQAFAGGSLSTDSGTRNQWIDALNRFLDVYQEALFDGWLTPFDGIYKAYEALSEMYEPSLQTASGAGAGAAGPHAAGTPPPAPTSFPRGSHFYLLRDHATGFVRRGQLNAETRFEEIILRPDSVYSVAYFDPETGRAGASYFRSAGAGETTTIPTALLLPVSGTPELADRFPDTDGDRLPDLVESLLGTDAQRGDTDGDGVRDDQEIRTGTDPLDGIGLPVGVVGVAATPGVPRDIAVQNGLAAVAASNGLAIYDVRTPSAPVSLAVLSGAASAVALDGNVLAAGFTNDLRQLDLSIPSAPSLQWSRADLAGAMAIVLQPQSIFVLNRQRLTRLDRSGQTTGALEFPQPVDDLAVAGTTAYVTAAGKLFVVDLSEGVPVLFDTLAFRDGSLTRRRRLSASDLTLFLQVYDGFGVYGLEDPLRPRLRQQHATSQFGWRDLVPVGPDAALAVVGLASTDDVPHDVSRYDLRPGGTNAVLTTTYPLPGQGLGLAISGARAFVLDELAGLVVLNFLPPDLGNQPPTVSLRPPRSDRPGAVEDDTPVIVVADAGDDVGVRQVELWVDDQRIGVDDNYPFEITYRTPISPPGGPVPRRVFRARATDTAGQVAESLPISVDVLPDATAPRIVSVDPPPDGVIVPGLVGALRVWLDEPVAANLAQDAVRVLGSGPDQLLDTADDAPVPGVISTEADGQVLVLTFGAPLPVGQYRAQVASGLGDRAGNRRTYPFVWSFRTGPVPFAATIYPFGPQVRWDGPLDEITAIFNQPLPKVFSDTYAWTVTAIDLVSGQTTPVNLTSELLPDARTYRLRPNPPLGTGNYRVNGSGPNVAPAQWDFSLRDVPNEVLSSAGGFVQWKYAPGPISNDVLIVNLPGTTVPLANLNLRSLTAETPVSIAGTLAVTDVARFNGGMTVTGSATLLSGSTELLTPWNLPAGTGLQLRSHLFNVRAGGDLSGGIGFGDAGAALVNHPTSSLVLGDAFRVASSGAGTNPVGTWANLGTLRRTVGTGTIRVEGPRVGNLGHIQVDSGALLLRHLDNDGRIELAAESRLVLVGRAEGGPEGSITGPGTVDFGEYDFVRSRLLLPVEAEFRGRLDGAGPLRVLGGTATVWPRLRRGSIELREATQLRLLAGGELGDATFLGGTLVLNSDSEIARLDMSGSAQIDTATLVRVTGSALLRNGRLAGRGTLEFAGITVVSNGTQPSFVRLLGTKVRNSGTWRMASDSRSGSGLDGAATGALAGGEFENAGLFEVTSSNPVSIRVPFRNRGVARLGNGRVTFERSSNGAGAYVPLPGAELVLANTTLDHGSAGSLDLASGTLSGTGLLQALPTTGPAARIVNRAELRVGAPTGTLQVNAGDGLELIGTSTLVMTLGSTASSRLESRAGPTAIRLGGTLRFELEPGFVPVAGQSFEILAVTVNGAGDLAGTFERVEAPELPPALKIDVEYQPRKVIARIAAR